MRTTFPGVDRVVSETCVARPLVREWDVRRKFMFVKSKGQNCGLDKSMSKNVKKLCCFTEYEKAAANVLLFIHVKN